MSAVKSVKVKNAEPEGVAQWSTYEAVGTQTELK
jgi:hypothetical protein